MFHHYMTGYWEDGERYVVSWIQLDVLRWSWCFSERKLKVEGASGQGGPECF